MAESFMPSITYYEVGRLANWICPEGDPLSLVQSLPKSKLTKPQQRLNHLMRALSSKSSAS